MSHDNRFSKTNYLKTNLLKQIKKNIFIDLAAGVIFFTIAKVQKKNRTTKQFYLFLQLINILNTKIGIIR